MSVARGITIEGLVCSYFVRNTKLYDTLMQMGRWFGHRRGYRDLCRIFMRKETQNWFEHIALATEELRDSIRCMKETGATPMDFGLRVRSSTPDLGLMITVTVQRIIIVVIICGIDCEISILNESMSLV